MCMILSHKTDSDMIPRNEWDRLLLGQHVHKHSETETQKGNGWRKFNTPEDGKRAEEQSILRANPSEAQGIRHPGTAIPDRLPANASL